MFCPNDDCPDTVANATRSEYRPDVATCPFCGSALVAEDPGPLPHSRDEGVDRPRVADDEELEPVIEATDLTEVAIIKSILDGAGVPYLTRGENQLSAFRGVFAGGSIFNPRARGVIFSVPARMAEEARALLEEIVDETDDSLPPRS